MRMTIFRVFKRSRRVETSFVLPKAYGQEPSQASAMNSLATFTIFFVIGVVSFANISALPSQDGYYGNEIGGGDDSQSTKPICARSEVYSRCGADRMCQKTCDNYDKPIACTRSGLAANKCEPGCVCKEGFVRVVEGDQCIPIDKCEGRVRH